ncbi:MAG TPA: Uma2 family endonuclease [Pyrinomonadaceae bacterium]|nr:Uma2 family endonuclease [Pyrinomonadaceae bacterium]
MESVLNPTLKEMAQAAINQKLILQGVGWDFYERILEEFADSNGVHFAYDDGFLEVEVPLAKHERPNRILQDLVSTICVEKNLGVRNFGSTTFRKALKAKGCEPDTAFYIQSERRIRGVDEIDLSVNPPPDLVIDIDVTSPSLNKLPIYAALGVSEVWLYKGTRVVFYKLYGGFYEETINSVALPMLDSETVTEFLQKGLNEDYAKWIREIREWINKR